MKRNIEKINQLADRIEKCEEVETDMHKKNMGPSFTMRNDIYECGSPACIEGHQQAMSRWGYMDWGEASEDLGITQQQGVELYAPEFEFACYWRKPGRAGHITKAHAVAVLRNLAATGEVDWKIGA